MMIKEYEKEFLFVVGGFKGRCCKNLVFSFGDCDWIGS